MSSEEDSAIKNLFIKARGFEEIIIAANQHEVNLSIIVFFIVLQSILLRSVGLNKADFLLPIPNLVRSFSEQCL